MDPEENEHWNRKNVIADGESSEGASSPDHDHSPSHSDQPDQTDEHWDRRLVIADGESSEDAGSSTAGSDT